MMHNQETVAAGPDSTPTRHGPRRPGWLLAAALYAAAAAGVVLFFTPLGSVTAALSRMTGIGLIAIMPAMALAGIALLALTFVLALGASRPRPVLLAGTLVAIVVCLDGVTAVTEPAPRFPTAYWITGFVDYVYRTGHTAPGLSAYFSWPGFFELVALAEHVAGHDNLFPVLRWWPLAMDLLCLVPMGLIISRMRASWRAKWFAAFIFTAGNWVGQDYFSPQSFNYLLYLLFIALLLIYFGRSAPAGAAQDPDGPAAAPAPARRRQRWRALLTRPIPGDLPATQAGRAGQLAVLGVLIVIFVFSTSSHQLTPFFMLAACAGLVIVGRCRLRGLPVLFAVIFAAWVSFATVPYWSGHLSDMFSGLGDLGGNLSNSVAGRMDHATAAHSLVLTYRNAFTAAVLLLAVAGWIRRRRHAFDDRVALVLMCVPFAGFGLQSYGGEIALRVYLFALPGACLLAAYLFFPAGPAPPVPDRGGGQRMRPSAGAPRADRGWPAVAALAAAAVCSVAAVLAFFVARYGNETFEWTPPGELAAMNYLYAHDSAGIRVFWPSEPPPKGTTPQQPWQYRDLSKTDYLPIQAPADPAAVSGIVAAMRQGGPGSYLITTTTQEQYLEQYAGYPADWGPRFRAAMRSYPGVVLAYSNPYAAVYTLRWPAGTRHQPLPPATAPTRPTIWTPVGLATLALLVLVLTAREVSRIWAPRSRRLARWLMLASGPLLVFFAFVVIIRFVVLA